MCLLVLFPSLEHEHKMTSKNKKANGTTSSISYQVVPFLLHHALYIQSNNQSLRVHTGKYKIIRRHPDEKTQSHVISYDTIAVPCYISCFCGILILNPVYITFATTSLTNTFCPSSSCSSLLFFSLLYLFSSSSQTLFPIPFISHSTSHILHHVSFSQTGSGINR